MSSIDKRIVQMQFDNQGFEKGVNTTLNSLNKLNDSIKKTDSSNGLSNIGAGVEKIASKFNAMGVVAASTLMNITNRAIDAGVNITKAFTIDPISDGFAEYETKMNAIQTILTNTASKGTTLDDVTGALAKLNEYADKTIYNFADMTRNIGTFTAAGIDLDTSVSAIKGIANLAAGSGSTPVQASTAMYQLSQALAAGKVSLMDWNSVVNAGMGGELFQNALKETAKGMGLVVDEGKPFRETLQDGWLTAEVLTKTLEGFAEDESLVKAATEVKTFTQLIDTMKESVGSGWATTWEHIIGNKEQAAELFTSISDGFNSIIQPSTDARNKMFEEWNNNGGRAAAIEGLTNVIKSMGKVLSSIGSAWKEVFPSMTGEKLTSISNKFKDLTEKFKINDNAAKKIKDTFKGLFDVVRLIGDGFISLIKGISPLGKVFTGLGPKILDVTSSIGKFFSNIRKIAQENGFFETMANGIKKSIDVVGSVITGFGDKISNLFKRSGKLDFGKFFSSISDGFKSVGNFLKPIIDGIGNTIGSINFDTVLNALKTSIAFKITKSLFDIFKKIGNVGDSAKSIVDTFKETLGSFKDIGSGISDAFGSLKDALEGYQKDLQAGTLIKIAVAIGILAGSLLLLSSIDGNKLAVGLGGLAGLFAELTASFVVMSKFGSFKGVMSIGTFLILFASSISLLTKAFKSLSELNPNQLMSGFVGLTSVILLTIGAVKLLGKGTKNLISTATGLLIFAAALHVMSGAIEKIGEIDSNTLGQGLGAIGILLGELAIFLVGAKFGGLSITSATGILILSAALLVLQKAVDSFGSMDTNSIIKGLSGVAGILAEILIFSSLSAGGVKMTVLGVALNLIAFALSTLSDAVKSFAGMSWEEIGRGLTAMAGGLTILGVASQLISGVKMTVVAVGIGAMSLAIGLLSLALKSMGDMSWEEIGRGLTVLAGALLILSVAMIAMSGAIAGAAALVIVAGAIALLTPQLLLLSQMSLEGLVVSLAAMAGAFTVLGLAGLLLGPMVPVLLGLAGAIALMGIGALASGVGISLMATGFGLLGAAIGGSGLIILEFIRQLIELLPLMGSKMGEGVVNFAQAIGEGAPIIISAITTLISQMLESMTTLIPQVVQLAVTTVTEFANGLATAVPVLVDAGLRMITGILEGIANNIGQLIDAGADCVINYLNGVADKLPAIIDAGINLALSFIEGVADGLQNNKDRIGSAIENVIHTMITVGMEVLASGIEGFIKGGKDLIDGAIDGIKSKWPGIKDAAKGAVDSAKDAVSNLGNALFSAGADLINGFMDGIKSKAQAVWDAAVGVGEKAIEAVKSVLGIHSPSRVFREIGKFTIMGMSSGLDHYSYMAEKSAVSVVDNIRKPFSNIGKIIEDDINDDIKITPVMDLSNVKEGSRLINSMIGKEDFRVNARTNLLAGSVGKIQNRKDNSDIISAIKELKEGLGNNTSYTINGITYDDGSNVSSAIETLVRAARIERRL